MKKIKKIMVCMIAASVLVLSITGCSSSSTVENTEESSEADTEGSVEDGEIVDNELAPPVPEADISLVKVDYGSSEIYSKNDMDAAIKIILDEFKTWDGCVLYNIRYTDDDTCKEGVQYLNEMGMDEEYVDCIVFKSDFHSPVEGGDAWEPDYDYEDWEWYLGRVSGGEWELITWGY